MRNARNRAFTLVEMLVVIAIIGVLVGLLLPGIQAIRETTRKMTCTTNLRTIGQAMLSYHSSNNRFPINYGNLAGSNNCMGFPSTTGPVTSTGRSWMIGILPYIDQQELFNTIRFDQGLNWTEPGSSPAYRPNVEAARTVISFFLCPSDRVDEGTRNDRDLSTSLGNIALAVTNYNAVSGSNWVYTEMIDRIPDPLSDGYDYLGLTGVQPSWLYYKAGRHAFEPNGIDCGNGIIHRGAYVMEPTSLGDLTDGASNTLAVGEVIPSYHPKKWWYWFDGSTATCAMPINFRPKQPKTAAGKPTEPTQAEWQRNCGFQSRHSGGANFLIADGSARFVTETIDIFLYRKLANFSSGEPDAIMPAE